MSSQPQARQLGLPMTIALVVGNMIGAGIFLLPAELAPYGHTAFYGWLVTIAGVLCLATTFMNNPGCWSVDLHAACGERA